MGDRDSGIGRPSLFFHKAVVGLRLMARKGEDFKSHGGCGLMYSVRPTPDSEMAEQEEGSSWDG